MEGYTFRGENIPREDVGGTASNVKFYLGKSWTRFVKIDIVLMSAVPSVYCSAVIFFLDKKKLIESDVSCLKWFREKK